MADALKAPFPWFGGKSHAAPLIWQALGDVPNFVDPFFGSGAVLLGRPTIGHIETVNDRDPDLANVWRALQWAPDAVLPWCDWPVNEADQHAIHSWLVASREAFATRIMGDPDYYDPQRAGRWLYGVCCWIGSGWCSGDGPWHSVDGKLVHLGNAGRGVHRKLVHLGDAGQGVHRKRVQLGGEGGGVGVHRPSMVNGGLLAWFAALQDRLRRVRVCCGDWTRVMGPSVTFKHGLTGIVLDPPYSREEGRDEGLYAVDDLAIAHAVRAWGLEHGDHPLLRIVLCGYGDVHDALLAHGWTKQTWTANGGMSNQNRDKDNGNKYRETLWCSPQCSPTTSQLAWNFG